MNFLKNISLLILFTTLLFTSCRKDTETFGTLPEVESQQPEIFVNGTCSGLVTDENNQGLEDAVVSFGVHNTTTDENGFFIFENVEINTKGSLVIVEKNGYYYNAKFVGSQLNMHNFTNIRMIEKTLTGSFTTNSGGTVTTSEGASVQFSENSIKLENGEVYTGNVNVYATWLDPTAADLTQRMPGDLRAINTENEQQQLTTYGMIGVELESDAGEALNISDGKTAVIELPVPASLIANAPSTIPLWHFDEASGFWIEDGEATLQGDKYVGTVSHFSFWNCDVPGDFVFIEGLVIDQSNKPLQNLTIIITEVSSGMTGGDITDEAGFYSGAVPIDQALIITILDNCGNELYSEPIGPFSMDETIPTITVTTVEDFVNLTGTLIDCDNNPVTNGYLKVNIGNSSTVILAEADGTFNQLISVCNATSIEVTGYDIDNLKQSTLVTTDIDGITNLDLVNVFVCEDLTEYIIYTVGDVETIDPNPSAKVNPNTGILRITAMNPDPLVGLPIINIFIPDCTAAGEYIPSEVFVIYTDDVLQTNIENNCEDMDCDVIPIEVTTYEGVDGFIIGSFSGVLQPEPFLQIGTERTVTGNFKILIEE